MDHKYCEYSFLGSRYLRNVSITNGWVCGFALLASGLAIRSKNLRFLKKIMNIVKNYAYSSKIMMVPQKLWRFFRKYDTMEPACNPQGRCGGEQDVFHLEVLANLQYFFVFVYFFFNFSSFISRYWQTYASKHLTHWLADLENLSIFTRPSCKNREKSCPPYFCFIIDRGNTGINFLLVVFRQN